MNNTLTEEEIRNLVGYFDILIQIDQEQRLKDDSKASDSGDE